MGDLLIRQRAVQNPAQKRGESADLPFRTLSLARLRWVCVSSDERL